MSITDAGSDKHFIMGDLEMDYKVSFERTPSGVAVHEWTLGPRRIASPPHKHEYEDEIFYILEGELTVLHDDDITTAGPDSYIVLPRGHFHTFWNSATVPVRLLVVLAPGRLEQYFEQASQLVQPGVPPDLAQLERLMQEYGIVLQFERMPELMARYGLQSDVPMPAGPPQNAG
ncbi:MAG: cupin domain-containing protein [Anaerolineales bacterium]|nr:cupin domain-containing protein [Anaerolineales bacterium]